MKRISSKNYMIVFGVIILIISACFAFNNLYRAYQENKISKSPLDSKEVLYGDLKNTTKELDADTLLVISYVQNERVHKNELEIKKTLTKHNLLENVTYLNITEYMGNSDFVTSLNKTLNLDKSLAIKEFPAVVYYQDGVPTYAKDSSEHLLNTGDFEQIIDMYELDMEKK